MLSWLNLPWVYSPMTFCQNIREETFSGNTGSSHFRGYIRTTWRNTAFPKPLPWNFTNTKNWSILQFDGFSMPVAFNNTKPASSPFSLRYKCFIVCLKVSPIINWFKQAIFGQTNPTFTRSILYITEPYFQQLGILLHFGWL